MLNFLESRILNFLESRMLNFLESRTAHRLESGPNAGSAAPTACRLAGSILPAQRTQTHSSASPGVCLQPEVFDLARKAATAASESEPGTPEGLLLVSEVRALPSLLLVSGAGAVLLLPLVSRR